MVIGIEKLVTFSAFNYSRIAEAVQDRTYWLLLNTTQAFNNIGTKVDNLG